MHTYVAALTDKACCYLMLHACMVCVPWQIIKPLVCCLLRLVPEWSSISLLALHVGSLYTCEYFCNHIAGTEITCLVCVFNFTLLANSPGVGWLSAGSMTSLFCACIAHKDLSVFQYALASDHCWSAVPWLLGSMFGTCNPHWTAVDLQSLSSL